MIYDSMTFADAIHQLDQWIDEGGEIATVARRVKARLPTEDDLFQLQVEIHNMRRYFFDRNP